MAKTNYSKVESSLEKGLEVIKIQRIAGKSSSSAENPKLYLIKSIKWDIERLATLDPEIFKKLGVSKRDIKKLIKKPDSLTDKDWVLLKDIRQRLDGLKKEILAKHPSPSNEELVQSERHSHINKRHNVNEKWLPLH